MGPFDVSGGDLVGLSPKEIASALQFKFAQDELGEKSIGNLVDMIYKSKLIEKADADIASDTPVFTIPGTNIGLTAKQYLDWKKLSDEKKTSTIKDYEYAKGQGFTGSIMDFKNSDETGQWKDYQRAKDEGYEGNFHQWRIELAKAGAVSIGDLTAREQAKDTVADIGYFSKSKGGLVDDIEKLYKDPVISGQISAATKPKEAKAQVAADFIKQKIIGSGGTVTGIRRVGGTLIWSVTWKDGTKGEVKHVFKD